MASSTWLDHIQLLQVLCRDQLDFTVGFLAPWISGRPKCHFPRNPTLLPANATALSQEHHCAIASSGDLLCWGRNSYCVVRTSVIPSHSPSLCSRVQASNDGYCAYDRPIVTPTSVSGLSSRPVAVASGQVSCPSAVSIHCTCIANNFVLVCDPVSAMNLC